MQITVLGNPELLKQLSRSMTELTRLFSRFDRDGNGFLHKDEFLEVYRELFVDDDGAETLFEHLDMAHDDKVDYVSFVDRLKLADLPALTSKCKETGPLKEVRAPPVVLHMPGDGTAPCACCSANARRRGRSKRCALRPGPLKAVCAPLKAVCAQPGAAQGSVRSARCRARAESASRRHPRKRS